MSLGSFFKGTSHEQNSRFKDKEKKLINSRKWPDEFEQRVDFSKVILKANTHSYLLLRLSLASSSLGLRSVLLSC